MTKELVEQIKILVSKEKYRLLNKRTTISEYDKTGNEYYLVTLEFEKLK